ncbi:hypothetical protein [Sphingobacterium psychroaquaticum]|uniref:hypothetical protein n=1 Tax=Sphingobacterium psychroaquaticum TaxID=561061 RepID=UPI001181A967|nr:hypothetical protein [Sphingobacterium psychroaquaticum]
MKVQYKTRWQKCLSAIFILPKHKDIYTADLWPATVYRLLGTLIDIKAERTTDDREVFEMLKGNIPLFIEFLAVGIHNAESEPPQWLYEALNYQFSNSELYDAVLEVYRRLDVETFFGITGSIREIRDLNLTLDPTVPGHS